MKTIDRNEPPDINKLEEFRKAISLIFPEGFLDFFEKANGANIDSQNHYTILWPVTEMIELNKEYDVDEYAPEFFLFGSDGSNTAFAIERETGKIFEIAFIGMSKEEALFVSNTFTEFLELR